MLVIYAHSAEICRNTLAFGLFMLDFKRMTEKLILTINMTIQRPEVLMVTWFDVTIMILDEGNQSLFDMPQKLSFGIHMTGT